MSTVRAMSRQEIVDKVLALVKRNLSGDELPLITQFVGRYYRSTADADLLRRTVENLYGAAVAHWHLLRKRKPQRAKVRVYNPHVEEHGWQSHHTVAEIVVDDMPFLVDSVRLAINSCGLANHWVIHPMLDVQRDAAGRLVAFADRPTDGAARESVMHVEFDRQTDAKSLQRVQARIENALSDVHIVVSDGAAMRGKLDEIIAGLEESPPPLDSAEFTEGVEFLRWLRNDNFIFLGFRDHDLAEEAGQEVLRIAPESSLGILRGQTTGVRETVSKTFASLPAEARERAHKPELLLITRSNSEATVHRKGHMDYVGIKRMDAKGRVVGERRFLGLYGSAAYTSSALAIPLLRSKVRTVLARAEFDENSHDGRALLNILETFPRDELFHIPEEELLSFSLGILQLQERQCTRAFLRRDEYGRFYSCIVYIPRDQMSTDVRRTVADILEAHLGGACVKFAVQVSESLLARVHYVIQLSPGAPRHHDLERIEAQIVEAAGSWREDFRTALLEQTGEERGTRLYNRYGDSFRAGYRDLYSPQVAVKDAEKMETLDDRAIAMSLYKPLEAAANLLRFKLFHPRMAVPLSDALPMLENMGLKVVDENPSKVKLPDEDRVWIHDFGIEHSESDLDLDRVKGIFQEAFARIFSGEVSNDGFNQLVLRAGLAWREILVLRAYCRYLRQVRATFSQEYIEQALAAHPGIARLLVELFNTRFDPRFEGERSAASDVLGQRITEALDQVQNLDEDRILRSFLGAIMATLRTNYFQLDNQRQPKSHLSFKLNPEHVPDMPHPRPKFEIFVYSPRVEGVHLRGGSVARGGLRWSDRPEDFRTEVLGLVKAQIVKNAVIVPVGSKGGFVPRNLPVGGSRDEILAEGVACYRFFISGLLDLTDNIAGGQIVPPTDVVRHDSDDPYLVVAADKGTATFSDIANEVAKDYGFWLGDAFASGGSAGYDHKGMGITAKGAWESVKRHFRELGVNTQSTPFTVVGIGDMAGDVFGNGMLLSRTIELVGAFNHMHIFLDPDPDPETSFLERERMFKLPRSSWEDYNSELISKGGGVFKRSAKSIALSPEIAAVLGVKATKLTPNEIIRALLKAPVDLLWNGGIGTYAKAAAENHADVGDRTNDGVRVNGRDLRCKVIGEGGNLGFTQLGRIEFARSGGLVNTDAIDNSAGVDCSDHEVNIKILLNAVIDAGDMTAKQRNARLASMTDEVARLVLKNNYRQTLALSLAKNEAGAMIDVHGRLMREMERTGILDRAIEFLPTDDVLFERKSANEGLSGPELAVVLAYVKIGLYLEVLGSDIPDDGYLEQVLCDYFPTPLQRTLRERMSDHRLRREIVATEVVNELVNRVGTTFVFRLRDESAADSADVVRAYLIAGAIFDSPATWSAVEGLDNQVSAKVQHAMHFETRKLLGRVARWLLRNRPRPLAIASNIDHFRSGILHLGDALWKHMGPSQLDAVTKSAEELESLGVPETLARRVALFPPLASALDILDVAQRTGTDLDVTAPSYFGLGEILDLHWLRGQVGALPRETHWQVMARSALRDDMSELHRELTLDVLASSADRDVAKDILDRWTARHKAAIDRCQRVIVEFRSGAAPDFAMLSVAMRDLRAMRHLAASVGSELANSKVA